MRTSTGIRRAARRGTARERGQVAVEFLGFLPMLVLLGLAAIQLGLAAYAASQAGTAARTAARTASDSTPLTSFQEAGRSSMSQWLADSTVFVRSDFGDEVTVTARVAIPSIIPGIDGFGEVERESTMPRD